MNMFFRSIDKPRYRDLTLNGGERAMKGMLLVGLMLVMATPAFGATKYSALFFPEYCAWGEEPDYLLVKTWGAKPVTLTIRIRDRLQDAGDNNKSFSHPVLEQLGPYTISHEWKKISLERFCMYLSRHIGDAFAYFLEVAIVDPNGITTYLFMEGIDSNGVTWQRYPVYTKSFK